MRHYEMVIMVHPNVSEEEAPAIVDRITGLITQHKGEVIRVEKWGKKKFAYKIKKCTKGYYFVLNFVALPSVLGELERILRYDENVLRFQTVNLSMEEVETIRRRGEQHWREDEQPDESDVPVEETVSEGQE